MKSIKAVIGNNFGDEGKGLLSRYYCLSSFNPIVILYNGSAQRGHTVETKDGRRHIFHHFGAGTLDGYSSYFAKTFMVHPMTLETEFVELNEKYRLNPTCYTDINCQVVTPIDVAIDQIYSAYIYDSTGRREYGSCSQGTWSCTDRLKFPTLRFTIEDFYKGDVIQLCNFIFDNWFQLELKSREVKYIPEEWKFFIENKDSIFQRFKQTIDFMKVVCPIVEFDDIYDKYSTLIFEGAQGLMLDKDFELGKGWNTTSHTGLDYIIDILKNKNDYIGEACYVSRSYTTRHGFGPFNEIDKNYISNDLTEDETNKYNIYQGNLRYSFLNEPIQKMVIENDVSKSDKFKVVRALTHCDEFEFIPDFYSIKSYSRFAEDIK